MKTTRFLSILLAVLMILSMMTVAVSAYTVPDGYKVAETPGMDEAGIDGEVYGLIGDSDFNDKVNVKDATTIQKYAASLITLDEIQLVLGDVNFDGKVNVLDATAIQKWVADMEVDYPINHIIYIPTETTPTVTESTPVETTPSETESTPVETTPSETESTPVETTPSETESTPAEEETITVYFTNNKGWENVYIYGFYGAEGTPEEDRAPEDLPFGKYNGVKMTYVEAGSDGDIYSYEVPADIDFIKFSDASADNNRTANIPNSMLKDNVCFSLEGNGNKWELSAIKTSTYGDPAESTPADTETTPAETTPAETEAPKVESTYFLRGTMTDWDPGKVLYLNEDGSASITLELAAGTYPFKIYDTATSTWYGNGDPDENNDGASFEDTITGWTFRDGQGNCVLIASGGVYTFKVYINDEGKLKVDVTMGGELPTETTPAETTPEESTPDESTPEESTPAGDTITVYFTDKLGWETVNVHYWGGTTETTWPGVEMEFVKINEFGYDVYKLDIPADSTGVVFDGFTDPANTDDKSLQTVSIKDDAFLGDGYGYYPDAQIKEDGNKDYNKWTVGTYAYEPEIPEDPSEATGDEPTDVPTESTPDETTPAETTPKTESTYFLRGTMTDWDPGSVLYLNEDGSASITLELAAGTYKFKIYDTATSTWYGNGEPDQNGDGASFEDTITGWTFRDGQGNSVLNASGGVYTFKVYTVVDGDVTKFKVDVTKATDVPADTTPAETTPAETTPAETTPKAESAYYLRGTMTDWDPGSVLYLNEDGSASITLELAAGTYKFKIYDSTTSTWYGNGEPDQNGDGASFEDTITGWTFRDGQGNSVLNASGGVYTFKVYVNDEGKLKVDVTMATDVPAETTPAETTPAETTPAETTPAETTPAETTPAETTPAETTPAETTPAETTPAETTPAETTPKTESTYFLRGTMTDWDPGKVLYLNEDGSASITLELAAGTYKFKIYDTATSIWYGNGEPDQNGDGASFEDTITGWTFRDGQGNSVLNASGGVYTFKVYTVVDGDVTKFKVDVTKATDVPAETTPAETTPAETTPAEVDTITVYFTDNKNWGGAFVSAFYGDEPVDGFTNKKMNLIQEGERGDDLYSCEVPADADSIQFSDGTETNQTDSVTKTDLESKNYFYPIRQSGGKWLLAKANYVPVEPETYTVYCVNSAKWTEVCAYAWNDGGSPAVAWPGALMTKTGEQVNGFDVYSYTFDKEYTNIIFNNNDNGSKTDDLTFETGKYYDVKGRAWYDSLEDIPEVSETATDRYLVGSFNGWSTTANEFMRESADDTVAYVELELDANTTYEFKIVRLGDWTSCKETLSITDSASGLTFSSSVSDNCKITTKSAGTYVFAFGIGTSQLEVTYP